MKNRNPLFPYGGIPTWNADRLLSVDDEMGSDAGHRRPIWIVLHSQVEAGTEARLHRAFDAYVYVTIHRGPVRDVPGDGVVLWVQDDVDLMPDWIRALHQADVEGLVYPDALSAEVPIRRPPWSPTLFRHTPYVGEALACPGALWRDFQSEGRPTTIDSLVTWAQTEDIPIRHWTMIGYRTLHAARQWVRRAMPLPASEVVFQKAALLVPSRSPALLEALLASLRETDPPIPYDVVVVGNGDAQDTLRRQVMAVPNGRFLSWNAPFNWSAINNRAASATDADLLICVNDDIVLDDPKWLKALVKAFEPGVGVVGAQLRYGNGDIQHAGLASPIPGEWVHKFQFLKPDEPHYLGLIQWPHEVSAVTGALLATPRAVFESLGGFEETLAMAYNDVDYCLRVWQADLRVVYSPTVRAIHQESVTRGRILDLEGERVFRARWGTYRDPYFPPGVTRWYGAPLASGVGIDL